MKTKKLFCGWYGVMWLVLMAACFGGVGKCRGAGSMPTFSVNFSGQANSIDGVHTFRTWAGAMAITDLGDGTVRLKATGLTASVRYQDNFGTWITTVANSGAYISFQLSSGGASGNLYSGQSITVTPASGATVDLTMATQVNGYWNLWLQDKLGVQLLFPAAARAISDPFNNNSSLDCVVQLYGVKADGTLVSLGTQTVKAGETTSLTAYGDAVLYPGGVRMAGTWANAQWDENGNIVAGGSSTVVASLGTMEFQTGSVAVPTPIDTSGLHNGGMLTANQSPAGTGTIPGKPNSADPSSLYDGTATDAADKATVANSAMAIVRALDADTGSIVKAIGDGSSGGGGGDTGLTGAALTDLNAIKAFDDAQNTLRDNNPTTDAMASAGVSKQGLYSSAFGSATGSGNGAVLQSGIDAAQNTDNGVWSITIPTGGGGGGIIVDLNPAHMAFVMVVFPWFKMVVTIILLYAFETWCWDEFKSYAVFMPMVPQAHGNPILAGTGAQATGLIAAGLLATVLISLPGALWAIYSGSFDVLASAAGVAKGAVGHVVEAQSGWFGAGLWMLTLAVPVGLICVLAGQVLVVKKAGLLVFSLACIAIKFVVP